MRMGNFRRALILCLESSNLIILGRKSIPISILSRSSILQNQNHQFGYFRCFSTNYNNHLPSDLDFSNEENKRRLFNQLLYRSRQRGLLELDLVLGKWVQDHIYSMDADRIKALISVLDLENPDLWRWLSGQEQPPEAVKTNPVFTAVQNQVMNNLNKHAASETRTPPGQQWVRGWDDFKRGQHSPKTGNQ